MTAIEEMAKELEERGLERQGAVNLWLRQWRPDLVVRLKNDHARLSDRFSRQLEQIPDIADPTEEDERAVNMLAKTWGVLREMREQMMRLALHPTCPKAQGPKKVRESGPIEEAQIIGPAVNPEGVPPASHTGEPSSQSVT